MKVGSLISSRVIEAFLLTFSLASSLSTALFAPRISTRILRPNVCSTINGLKVFGFRGSPLSSMSTSTNDSATLSTPARDLNSWDLKGLKSEASRIYLRTFKKIAKCNERISKASTPDNANSDLDLEVAKTELDSLQNQLGKLADLEASLKNVRSTTDKSFPEIVKLATELGVSDVAPPKQERGESKPKGKQAAPRKPYFPYLSADGIIIRVGREAPDNDILSCDPNYRLPDEWWLHVSGFPGSHVVIRSTSNTLPTDQYETLKDAALLAAVNSKAAQAGKVLVTYTRCRNASKPSGAKAGLVQLRGDVATLTINIKAEAARLDRLMKTKGTPENE